MIGDRAEIRWGTVIYGDTQIGDDFKTGHSAMIRERTVVGNRVVIGTNTVVDGNVTIGDDVKIESSVYIPTHATIGSQVFIGPGAVLTNDKYPQRLRDQYVPSGPVLEDSVTVGANSTILPGVRIGEGSMIAAGSVVTKDVPPWSLVVGVPARIEPLPEKLRERNRAKTW
jgi:acetyltransferase-like isoleucine patch superfamily enzyme